MGAIQPNKKEQTITGGQHHISGWQVGDKERTGHTGGNKARGQPRQQATTEKASVRATSGITTLCGIYVYIYQWADHVSEYQTRKWGGQAHPISRHTGQTARLMAETARRAFTWTMAWATDEISKPHSKGQLHPIHEGTNHANTKDMCQ